MSFAARGFFSPQSQHFSWEPEFSTPQESPMFHSTLARHSHVASVGGYRRSCFSRRVNLAIGGRESLRTESDSWGKRLASLLREVARSGVCWNLENREPPTSILSCERISVR